MLRIPIPVRAAEISSLVEWADRRVQGMVQQLPFPPLNQCHTETIISVKLETLHYNTLLIAMPSHLKPVQILLDNSILRHMMASTLLPYQTDHKPC